MRGTGRDCGEPHPFSPPSPPDPQTAGGRPRGRRPHDPPAGPGGRPPPPPPPPPRGQRHPGRGATAAARAAVRSVPPVSRPPTPAVPAAQRQPCAGAQEHPMGRNRTGARGREPIQCGGPGNDEVTRLGARPGTAERRTAAGQPSRPPPRGAFRPSPVGGAAHRPPPPPPCQTDPPASAQAGAGARGCQTAAAERAAGRDAPAMK